MLLPHCTPRTDSNCVPPKLQRHRDFVLKTVQRAKIVGGCSLTGRSGCGLGLAEIVAATPFLCADREIILSLLENHGSMLQYACVELRADRTIAEVAIRFNSPFSSIQFQFGQPRYMGLGGFYWVSDTLKADRGFVLMALHEARLHFGGLRRNGDATPNVMSEPDRHRFLAWRAVTLSCVSRDLQHDPAVREALGVRIEDGEVVLNVQDLAELEQLAELETARRDRERESRSSRSETLSFVKT